MQIDKSQILDLLRGNGDQQKAEQADRELPEKVDTERDQGMLEKFGLNPQDLISKFTGGGGGGLGGMLGR